MKTEQILATFARVSTSIGEAFINDTQRNLSGLRDTQYTHDVAADAVAVSMLTDAGFGVFSEESGLHDLDREIIVVVDPIDGSTNAALGVPWFASSLCATRDGVPIVASVVNLASGDRFVATRDGGTYRNGVRVTVRSTSTLAKSVVALSGYPDQRGSWEQFRVFGACALDMALVAAGVLDGFADADDAHGPWDYLAAMLLVQEAGGVVVDAFERDLVVFAPDARRSPIAACTNGVLQALVAERQRWSPPRPGSTDRS